MEPAVPFTPDDVPAALRARAQWVVWRIEDTGRGATKVPYQPARPASRASTREPRHWTDFATAVRAWRDTGAAGAGFVLTAEDPFVGVDLDGVLDSSTGAVARSAANVVRLLDTYTEASPSGTGIHLILEGTLERLDGRKQGPIEVYDRGRYLTMTGRVLGERREIRSAQHALEAFHAAVFGAPDASGAEAAAHDADDHAQDDGGFSEAGAWNDHELLDRMFESRHGDAIEALYRGDTTGYPSHSEADLALAAHLAWWTGYDRERANRLFRGSGLYRPKWDERHYADGRTYGEGTIDTAMNR